MVNRHTTLLPAPVQYAWRHPTQPRVFVVSSDGGPGRSGDNHYATALTLRPTGELSVGESVQLTHRPLHCTVDRTGEHLLIAYNTPSHVSVHRLGADGEIGPSLTQTNDPEFHIYAHQVMVTASNDRVIVPARGLDGTDDRPADTGALLVFGYKHGQLKPLTQTSPMDEFGPRHLDFHPNGRWLYLSVERQNELHMYDLSDAGLSGQPRFSLSSLASARQPEVRQIASAVHVHPNGRYVYQANRSDGFHDRDGWRLGRVGEDTLAVYAIDENTGEPSLIQHVSQVGTHVRTFSIDPTEQLLI